MAEGVATQAYIEEALHDWSDAAPDIDSTRSAARDSSPDHLPHDFSRSPSFSASRPSRSKRFLAPRRTPFQPPEPRSINDVLRQHCRERLYVHPLRWTSRQLLLLDCQFVANKDIGHAVDKKIQKRKDNAARAKQAAYGLIDAQSGGASLADETIKQRQATGNKIRETLGWLRMSSKSAVSDMQDLLEHQGFSRLDLPLYLSFGGRKANQLQPGAIFNAPECTNPSVAFINLDTIQKYRLDYIARPEYPAKKINKPSRLTRYKDWYRLKPRNPLEDPYIVAILIALAQAQRCHVYAKDDVSSGQTSSPIGKTGPASQDSQEFTAVEVTLSEASQNSYKVHVLALSLPCLDLYTAKIPASLLDRLDYPSRYFPSEPFDVSHFEIPLRGVTRAPLMRHALSVMRG